MNQPYEFPDAGDLTTHQATQAFSVNTPIGKLYVHADQKIHDSAQCSPGVYVDFINPFTQEPIQLGCIEYRPDSEGRGHIQSCINKDAVSDIPSHVIIHENINIADLEVAQQKIEDYFLRQFGDHLEADFSDLERIPVARTCIEDTDEELEAATYLDLVNYACWTDIAISKPDSQSVTVRSTAYPTLAKLIEDEIEHLNFCELVSLDDKDWDNFTWSDAGKTWLKHYCPAGTRIRLTQMDDLYPVVPGTEGTVDQIDGTGNIHVLWDDGRTLALAYGIDQFSVISRPRALKTDYPPVYRKPWSAAMFFSEEKMFRESMDENVRCVTQIEQTISHCYTGYCLKTDIALSTLLPEFGPERLSFILANTIRSKMNDGRIDRINKEWAYSVSIPGDDRGHDYNPSITVGNTNPGLINLSVNGIRKSLASQ